jgi:hypothetical protein
VLFLTTFDLKLEEPKDAQDNDFTPESDLQKAIEYD